MRRRHVLGGKGFVVHEQKVHIVDVVDEEGLVARGHHVPRLLVAAISDLSTSSAKLLSGLLRVSLDPRPLR